MHDQPTPLSTPVSRKVGMDRLCYQLCLGLLPLFPLGCVESDPDKVDNPADVGSYSSLTGLAKTHHQELRAEHERLVSEGATPTQLAGRRHTEALPGDVPAVRFDGNRAAEQIFPPADRPELERALERTGLSERFSYHQEQVAVAAQIGQAHQEQRHAFLQMLERPDLEFRVDHTRGLGADTQFVDAVQLGCKLESITIVNAIEHGRLEEATRSLQTLFLGVEALSRVDHLVPRIAAVHLREDLMSLLGLICEHQAADRGVYERLQALLTGQLERWPPDAGAWIGERACGLHTYELVRDGYLLSLLTFKELRDFREEVGVDQLGRLVMKNLDVDQLFYLTVMRMVITSCEKPFYGRRVQLQQVDRELEQQRQQATYPIVADHILLRELFVGQRLQAVDRARVEAWRLALAAALGEKTRRIINPLTGHPFVVDAKSTSVIVDGIDPEDPYRIVKVRVPPP